MCRAASTPARERPGTRGAGVATITFHAAKAGLWINPGKALAGGVEVADIGIPRGAPMEPSAGLLEPRVRALLPRRGAGSTKFSSGQV